MCRMTVVIGFVAATVPAAAFWQPPVTPPVDRSSYLVLYPSVQKDLELTQAQSDRVKEIFKDAGTKSGPERQRILNEGLGSLLETAQSRRLGEIHAQVLFVRGALPAKLTGELKLTDEQRNKLDAVLKQNEAENRKLARLLMTGQYRTKQALEAIKKKYYEPARERLKTALTEDQWKTIQRRLGQEFPGAFEMAQDI